MIEEWNTGENKWLKRLYERCGKWHPAFTNDTFSAGIRSSQSSESTNSVFQHMTNKSMNLIEFIHQY